MRVGVLVGYVLVAGLVGIAALVLLFGLGRTTGTKVTPSRAITYITGPLRDDGSVDYVAALDERCREGVNAENNASVLLWQALGPLPLPHDRRDAFFQSLGIAAPPEQGDYFCSLNVFADVENVVATILGGAAGAASEVSVEELELQLDEAATRPWTQEEFGRLAEWLQANEGPLELVVQASHRPRRYDPLVPAPEELYRLIYVDRTMTDQLRDFSRALVVRGMNRASRGQIDEAWEDLMAVHRLARLTMQGPMMVDSLAGMEISCVACTGNRALLQHVKLAPEQIARMHADQDQLVPVPDFVNKIDLGERMAWLDSMVSAAGLMSRGAIDPDDEELGAALRKISARSVDWNRVSKEMNAWADRYVAACGEPIRANRSARLARLDEELKGRTANATKIMARIPVALGWRAATTEYVSMAFCTYSTLPLAAAWNVHDRSALDLELTKLAFALAAYQADHGGYPEKLSDLVPQYIAKVPDDLFADAPIRYTVGAEGYVLHSDGPDGEEAGADLTESDDVVVRMPIVAGSLREP
jgi:hypothetical protein